MFSWWRIQTSIATPMPNQIQRGGAEPDRIDRAKRHREQGRERE
jgi:hypothetical protein